MGYSQAKMAVKWRILDKEKQHDINRILKVPLQSKQYEQDNIHYYLANYDHTRIFTLMSWDVLPSAVLEGDIITSHLKNSHVPVAIGK